MKRVWPITLWLCEWLTGAEYCIGFRRYKYIVCWSPQGDRADLVSLRRRRWTEFSNLTDGYIVDFDALRGAADPFLRKRELAEFPAVHSSSSTPERHVDLTGLVSRGVQCGYVGTCSFIRSAPYIGQQPRVYVLQNPVRPATAVELFNRPWPPRSPL